MPYQLRMFGGWDLSGPDGASTNAVQPHSKAGALLAVLGTRPPDERVSREELVGLLWPESPERRARNSLRVTLSNLREILPGGALGEKGRERLWLDPSVVESDVREFAEALAEDRPDDALDVYRGPFLEHVHLTGAGAFNRWADERRGHYGRRAYGAALAAGAGALEEEKLPRAEEAYRKALELEPFKEEAAAALMRVLARQGKRADALRLHEAFTERLSEELDLSPSEELGELADRIRSEPSNSGIESGPIPPAPEQTSTAAEGVPPRGAWRRGRFSWGMALLVLGALGLGAWVLTDRMESRPTVAANPTIAVLPFQSLGERGPADFAAGMHAGLLTRLAGVSDLRVKSGTTVRQVPDSGKSLSEIGRDLGVDWILEGEIQRTGAEVQVNAQLVDARRDVHLWAESYHRDSLTARNVFQIQGDLVRRIVRALEVELAPREERRVASVPTENTAAYELFLQAERLREPGGEDKVLERKALYDRTLQLDSAYAAAWAGLADSYVDRAWAAGRDETLADSGRAAARHAIDLNPDLADGYVQLADAHWVLGDRDTARHLYRSALELEPDNPHAAENLSILLSSRGDFAEKAQLLDRLVKLSPRSEGIVGSLIGLNELLGRTSVADGWRRYAREEGFSYPLADFDRALFGEGDAVRARRLLEDLPSSVPERHRTRRRAALALYEGRWRDARRLYRRLYPSPPAASNGIFHGLLEDGLALAWSLHRIGQQEEAREITRSVISADSAVGAKGRSSYVYHRQAVARLILGDTARALTLLDTAVDVGNRDARTLQHAPTLVPLRDHPRFRSVLARIDSLVAEERRRIEAGGWAGPPEVVFGEDRSGSE